MARKIMAAHRHLQNAPVREALIDIQFGPAVSLDSVAEFVAKVGPSYSQHSAIWQAFLNFESHKDAPPTTSSNGAQTGIRLDSEDGKFVIQAKVNGLTLSRLNPYGQWAQLKEEAQRWWDLFEPIAAPDAVTRLAVRYINTINVPLPLDNFAEYLACPPGVPSELSQGLNSFLYRVEIPDDGTRTMSIITQALEQPFSEPDGSAKLPVVLDIDVSRQVGIEKPNFDTIWLLLEELRDQKNKIFFSYLTEKTVEMFE